MLEGFMCPKSKSNTTFNFCWKACVRHCKPLPVLLALAHQDRASEENVYHVTEILNPPQQVYLKRNNPYYVRPDSLIDMMVGTSWHEKLAGTKKYVQELDLQDDYLMEQNFKRHFAVYEGRIIDLKYNELADKDTIITLSGTSDLYVKSTKTLYDYKVMKFFYTFKYLSEGKWDDSTIPWQMNIYRVYQYPEAEDIKIFCYLKDYKLNLAEKYDLSQTEELHVPLIPDNIVKDRVVELLAEHVTAQKTGKPRPCTEEEMWNKKVRCTNYCSVRDICPQFNKEGK